MVSYGSIGYYDKAASQVHSTPLNFFRSGAYYYSSGSINERSNSGYYWQSRVDSETNAEYLAFHSDILAPQYNGYKSYGFVLRCLVPLAFLLFLAQQLPTYSGTKSYQNLLVEVYGMQVSTSSLTTTNSDSILQFLPTNFIRNGYYSNSYGSIGNRSSHGAYWQLKVVSNVHARSLYFYSTRLGTQDSNDAKGYGNTIRCLVR